MKKIVCKSVMLIVVLAMELQAIDLTLTEITTKNDLYIAYKDQNGKTYLVLISHLPLERSPIVSPLELSEMIDRSRQNRIYNDLPKKVYLDKIPFIILPVENKQGIEIKRDTLYQNVNSKDVYDIVSFSLLPSYFQEAFSSRKQSYDFVFVDHVLTESIRNPKLKELRFTNRYDLLDVSLQRKVSESPFLQ